MASSSWQHIQDTVVCKVCFPDVQSSCRLRPSHIRDDTHVRQAVNTDTDTDTDTVILITRTVCPRGFRQRPFCCEPPAVSNHTSVAQRSDNPAQDEG